jgi:hypothetical protein
MSKTGYTLTAAVALAACVTGCGRTIPPRRSQLDSVHRAALKVQSRTATGVTLREYPEVISGLAFELSLVKGLALDQQDTEALKKFEAALLFYVNANDAWAASAAGSHVVDRVMPIEGYLQFHWRTATWDIEEADMLRRGFDPTKERIRAAMALRHSTVSFR